MDYEREELEAEYWGRFDYLEEAYGPTRDDANAAGEEDARIEALEASEAEAYAEEQCIDAQCSQYTEDRMHFEDNADIS